MGNLWGKVSYRVIIFHVIFVAEVFQTKKSFLFFWRQNSDQTASNFLFHF